GPWALVRQKPQVGDATLDGEIEQLVIRRDDRGVLAPCPVCLGGGLTIDRRRFGKELGGTDRPANGLRRGRGTGCTARRIGRCAAIAGPGAGLRGAGPAARAPAFGG